VKIHFNVWQKSDGTGNWPQSPLLNQFFQETVDLINGYYIGLNSLPTKPVPGAYPHVSDTRIRFESEVFYYPVGSLYGSNSGINLKNYIKQHHPERLEGININVVRVFTSEAGSANRPYYNNDSHDLYIMTSNKATIPEEIPSDPWSSWAFANHIAHELGHNFGLFHPYYNNPGNCCHEGYYDGIAPGHPDWLSDVFELVGNNTWLCANPQNGICYHNGGYSCSTTDPLSGCTNNFMGGVNGGNYKSPLQIGRMRRELALKTTRKYGRGYHNIPHRITQNETWDFSIKFYQDIVIKPGATLTIKCEVQMVPQAKIVVKPGGKLVIDGGRIGTDYFNKAPWQGIYVEGNPNLPQTFANQGVLILQNGAIIENAWDAVMLRSVGSNWRQNGGIIQATDAIFRNNWRNVEFMLYDYPSISFFTNCIFETNSQTLHTQHTSNVTMWNVQAVKFTNCTFQDTRPNINYYNYRTSRDGIYTIDASFEVSDGCEFVGMKYGIYATASVANRTLKVYDSNFSSYRGIYFNNMNNSHVADNTFFVKPGFMYSGGSPIETYGLYLENSQNYQVTGNILTSTGTWAPCTCNSFGVIVRNTGTLAHEIYRNDFTGFQVGIHAIGQNRSFSAFPGLQIRCNRFYNTTQTDIDVVKDPLLSPNITQGINYQQGATFAYYSNTILGGNIFTPDRWYSNNAETICYYHHKTSSHSNLLPSFFIPSKLSFLQTQYNYQYVTSCPARLLSPPRQMMLAEMENGLAGQGATEIKLLEMTDAGSTQLMLQQVEMANVGDAYHTYRHLMKTSPWLSEEVLVAVASREEGFTHAMIRDILVANPQAAKSEKVMQALKNRRNALPGFMLSQVRKRANQPSEKELLESQMMSYKDMHDMALNQIIRNTMQNPENKSEYASLKELLTKVDDRSYQYLLSEILFSEKDYAAGKRVIKSIETRFPFKDKNEWNHHEKFISFYNLLEKWDNEEHPGFSNLPEEVLTELKSYVNTGHRTSGAALAILMLNNAIEYKEPIYYPEEEMVAKTAATAAPLEILAAQPQEGFDFRVFPNPGRDYITFEWCSETELTNNSRIEIYNAAGVLSRSLEVSEPCNQALFSLENLQSGNYIAKFISGTTAKNISFVVSR
jgi:hypothetical protein